MLKTPMSPSIQLARFLTQPDMEGLRLTAYPDGIGVWTLGAGATRIPDGKGGTRPVVQGDTCTVEQALQWEDGDLADAARVVNASLSGAVQQWEFDAFVSLTFNIGVGNERKVSAVALFNAGEKDLAAHHLLAWDQAGGVVENGLVKRRHCEAIMLLGRPWRIAEFADDSNIYISTATLTRCMAAYQ